jgi:type I restriction enzyme S subunit
MIVPLSNVDIAPQHWSMIDRILRRCLPDQAVWAYGSRVTGHSWQYSDLDLVVVGATAVDSVTMWNARDAFSASRLPYIVDLKDWQRIPQHWRDEILNCYAVIHSPEREKAVNESCALSGIGREGDLDAMRSSDQS